MSTTMYDAARTTQEQFLATVRQSQDAVVEAVATWAKAVEKLAPPTPTLPGSEDLPKPEAVIEGAFDFARKVVAAAAPVLEKSSKSPS